MKWQQPDGGEAVRIFCFDKIFRRGRAIVLHRHVGAGCSGRGREDDSAQRRDARNLTGPAGRGIDMNG